MIRSAASVPGPAVRRSAARRLSRRATLVVAALLAAAPLSAQTPQPPAATAPAQRPAAQTDEQLRAMLEGRGLSDVRITDSDRRKVEFSARDADGRRIEIEVARFGVVIEIDVEDDRPGPASDLMGLLPPPAQEAARQVGIVDLREFDRSRRGMKIEGLDAEGRKAETRIETDGRLMPRDERWSRGPMPAPAEVRGVVERAGYTVRGDIETRRAHAAVIATNPEGETVEVHVAPGGRIVREIRRLDLE